MIRSNVCLFTVGCMLYSMIACMLCKQPLFSSYKKTRNCCLFLGFIQKIKKNICNTGRDDKAVFFSINSGQKKHGFQSLNNSKSRIQFLLSFNYIKKTHTFKKNQFFNTHVHIFCGIHSNTILNQFLFNIFLICLKIFFSTFIFFV